MESYLLENYELTCAEVLQSLLVSEYGIRHLKMADRDIERKWGHWIIAFVQFIPGVGQLAMAIDWLASRVFGKSADPSGVKNEWLFEGDQTGHKGSVDRQRSFDVLNRLNQSRDPSIYFNPAKLTGYIEGGVCTALALDFADAVSKLRHAHVVPGQGSNDLFLSRVRDLGARFARSSEEMKIRQAAFNTIEFWQGAAHGDVSRKKIQSLARFHNFNIHHTSREIAIDHRDLSQIVEEEVEKLPNGVHLLRSIQPANNEKLEVHGHSMVYVKEGRDGLFYDPNFGVRWIRDASRVHASQISLSLTSILHIFQQSRARFYQLSA